VTHCLHRVRPDSTRGIWRLEQRGSDDRLAGALVSVSVKGLALRTQERTSPVRIIGLAALDLIAAPQNSQHKLPISQARLTGDLGALRFYACRWRSGFQVVVAVKKDKD